jgi:23S rRNA pseudouridine1911/1915/1917 synthase
VETDDLDDDLVESWVPPRRIPGNGEPLPASLVPPPDAIGMRLDTWLSRLPGAPSRNRVQQLVKDCLVLVDGVPARASHEIAGGERVEITWPELADDWPYPQEIPIDVVHEDDQVIVVNKQHNLLVHPSGGHPDGTLVNGLLHRYRDLPGINGVRRPGIVHRLDKDTTGLMVVARTDRAMKSLAGQLADRTMNRQYLALAIGSPNWEERTVDAAIGRDAVNRLKRAINGGHPKSAISHFRTLIATHQFALLRCKLQTGRTHQIRIHLRHIGHPIVCDEVYDGHTHRCVERLTNTQFDLKRLLLRYNRPFLHAQTLRFRHPTLDRMVSFQVPPPADSLQLLSLIFGAAAEPFLGTRQVIIGANRVV